LFVSIIIVYVVYYLVTNNLKARYLILSTIFATYILNVVMPLTSMRYAGFFYFSFLCGLWIVYQDQTYLPSIKKKLVFLILIIQIPRGVYSLYQDFRLPFSQAESVVEMLKALPQNSNIISTYWCINNLSAYVDKPYYCIETKKMESFILWDSNLKTFVVDPNSYKSGLDFYFKTNPENYVYLFSTLSTSEILQIDCKVLKEYNFRTIQKKEGAIERSGNIYLYKVNPK
ncbi:MAG: hypothetical protein K2Q22_01690, partial [Cytophagales bacterium]|nr:hypothetical protein [Cytophagales bacterium]